MKKIFQYRVRPGDTLYRIADYFDVTVAAILAANYGLLPNRIFPGQVIFIPISGFLYQNYPWYFLFPYLFIQRPRHYWDDRRRWPRDWHDRGGRDRRDGRDRWDGRGRSSMGNWNILTAQSISDFEEDQDAIHRNGINGVPGMQPDTIPEGEIIPSVTQRNGINGVPGMQPGYFY